MNKLTCIIPAYNEGARIGAVLSVVTRHPLIDEIIVVDDGSSDDTADVAEQFAGVRLVRKLVNGGKSSAVYDGIMASSGSLLLLLDADLVSITVDNLTQLIEPVVKGRADCSISLRGNALLPWRLIGLDYVSGERVLHRDLLQPHLETIAQLPGFGIEVFINDLIMTRCHSIKVVRWAQVASPYKCTKYGFWPGLIGELRMLANIVSTISFVGSAQQIVALLRARV